MRACVAKNFKASYLYSCYKKPRIVMHDHHLFKANEVALFINPSNSAPLKFLVLEAAQILNKHRHCELSCPSWRNGYMQAC